MVDTTTSVPERSQHTLMGKAFHGFPHLLDFADAEFGLIEKDEMLVQVLVAIKYKTTGVKLRVASRTSGFLHVILQ